MESQTIEKYYERHLHSTQQLKELMSLHEERREFEKNGTDTRAIENRIREKMKALEKNGVIVGVSNADTSSGQAVKTADGEEMTRMLMDKAKLKAYKIFNIWMPVVGLLTLIGILIVLCCVIYAGTDNNAVYMALGTIAGFLLQLLNRKAQTPQSN